MACWILRCPECGTKFKSPTVEGPEFCPNKTCGIAMHDDEDNVIEIKAPFIRSHKMKAVDDVYRGMEKTSESRMYAAAEQAGVSASEMAGLKITNMRDNVKPGETYDVPVVNAVTQRMDEMKAKGMPIGFAGAEMKEFIAGAKAGPHANAGAKTLNSFKRAIGTG